MLELQNVSINLENRQIINDISFHLQKKEVLSIVGESGVGKTTLLRAIAGLVDVEGMITFDGNNVIGPSEKLVPGVVGISTVFQDYQLMHNRTVFENIAYPLRSYIEEDQVRLTTQLLDVLMLTSHKDHYPTELSGGQKQRVAIARALASEPGLLLLDEPFSNMNVALKEVIKKQVFSYLKREEITAILVTHDPKDALAVSDKIAILKSGIMVQLGSPKEVYKKPVGEYVMSCFGHSNFWNKEAFEIDFGRVAKDVEFNRAGVRVNHLNVVDLSEASCKVKVRQSIYQGENYLIFGKLESGNEVCFSYSEPIAREEEIGLSIDESKINYFL